MTKVINLDNLPSNIALVRNELDASQDEFGKLIGATKAMVFNFEKGFTPPKPKFIEAIATLAGITPEFLTSKKLQPKDISVRIGRSVDNTKTVKLLATILAHNIIIIKTLCALNGGKSKIKVSEIFTASIKDVEIETEKILKEMKNF